MSFLSLFKNIYNQAFETRFAVSHLLSNSSDPNCSYFNYNGFLGTCRHFGGRFSMAPTFSMSSEVSGPATCTQEMTTEEKGELLPSQFC